MRRRQQTVPDRDRFVLVWAQGKRRKPGRKFDESVKLFSPYDRTKDPYNDAHAAGSALIREALADGGKRKIFIFVNNRLEGNALETIARILEQVRGDQ